MPGYWRQDTRDQLPLQTVVCEDGGLRFDASVIHHLHGHHVDRRAVATHGAVQKRLYGARQETALVGV